MKILCFGDSNTFGYIPGGAGRYNKRTRWPGLLKRALGESCQVVEEGVCGRTTAFEDKTCSGRCGLDDIRMDMELYHPVDMLIIMLGTNDCKTQFQASAGEIAAGLEQVLNRAEESVSEPFQTLVIAPACLKAVVANGDFGSEFDMISVGTSKELAAEFEKIAGKHGCLFLDASKVTAVSDVDGVHLDEAGHEALAKAVHDRILNIVGEQEG